MSDSFVLWFFLVLNFVCAVLNFTVAAVPPIDWQSFVNICVGLFNTYVAYRIGCLLAEMQ